jgi:hypothetical protein
VDTPNDDAAAPLPSPGWRLRTKLPEILIEAASIVVAVLLAFAVDEWRDARAKRQLAERARASVLAELRANHEELLGTHAANARQLESLQHTLDLLAADPKARKTSVELAFSGAQLSDAAWETTRTTQAIQLLPFEWVLEIARVYEVQALYKTAQLDMLQRTRAAVAAFGTTRNVPEIVAPLGSQLQTFQSLGDQLRTAYEKVLGGGAARRR